MPLNSILASLFSTGICFAFSFSYFDALTLKKISDLLSSYGPLCHYDFLFYKWGQFIFTDLTLPEFLCPTGTQNLSHLPQQFPAAFGGTYLIFHPFALGSVFYVSPYLMHRVT